MVVAALFVAGLVFRVPILVVGPLLKDVQADLAMSHGVAGLLSSIPVLCMAFLAPIGPVLAASIGPRLAVAACIVAVAGFGLVRAIAPDALT
jgi:CP family cyanate transporter-like MFS transporter